MPGKEGVLSEERGGTGKQGALPILKYLRLFCGQLASCRMHFLPLATAANGEGMRHGLVSSPPPSPKLPMMGGHTFYQTFVFTSLVDARCVPECGVSSKAFFIAR